MYKSTTILLVAALLAAFAVAIVAWFMTSVQVRVAHPQSAKTAPRVTTNHALAKTGFPPPPISRPPPKASEAKFRVTQINVAESAVLDRQYRSWLNTRGCSNLDFFNIRNESASALQTASLNGDLTAANHLAWVLLFMEPGYDGRTQAKKVLWQAMLHGSTCAFYTYAVYWRRARDGKREITHSKDRDYVHYILNIPKTAAAKRLAIMKDYAWDMVYEMRTGTPQLGGGAARAFEEWYHFKFQPTAAEYAYACQRANHLYQTLQSDREAEGLGPFDNSPPPAFVPRFGDDALRIGEHCQQWPVPRPDWKLAELHVVQRNGEIDPVAAWIPAAKHFDPFEEIP